MQLKMAINNWMVPLISLSGYKLSLVKYLLLIIMGINKAIEYIFSGREEYLDRPKVKSHFSQVRPWSKVTPV